MNKTESRKFHWCWNNLQPHNIELQNSTWSRTQSHEQHLMHNRSAPWLCVVTVYMMLPHAHYIVLQVQEPFVAIDLFTYTSCQCGACVCVCVISLALNRTKTEFTLMVSVYLLCFCFCQPHARVPSKSMINKHDALIYPFSTTLNAITTNIMYNAFATSTERLE